MTLAGSASPFVVQLALLTTWWLLRVVGVLVHPEHERDVLVLGRRRDDHLLRAGLAVGRAFSASVKMPVDSMTMSTPRSPHGSAAGSRSLNDRIERPSTTISLSPAVHLAVEAAVGRVVLEQVRVRLVVGEIVDGHDLERVGVALEDGLEASGGRCGRSR